MHDGVRDVLILYNNQHIRGELADGNNSIDRKVIFVLLFVPLYWNCNQKICSAQQT